LPEVVFQLSPIVFHYQEPQLLHYALSETLVILLLLQDNSSQPLVSLVQLAQIQLDAELDSILLLMEHVLQVLLFQHVGSTTVHLAAFYVLQVMLQPQLVAKLVHQTVLFALQLLAQTAQPPSP